MNHISITLLGRSRKENFIENENRHLAIRKVEMKKFITAFVAAILLWANTLFGIPTALILMGLIRGVSYDLTLWASFLIACIAGSYLIDYRTQYQGMAWQAIKVFAGGIILSITVMVIFHTAY